PGVAKSKDVEGEKSAGACAYEKRGRGARARGGATPAILRSERPASPSTRRALAADKQRARSDWPLLVVEPERSGVSRPPVGLDRPLRGARYGGGPTPVVARLRATGGGRLRFGDRTNGWQRVAALSFRLRARRRTPLS